MKSLKNYINEAKEVVMLSYINRLKDEFQNNSENENLYDEICDKLGEYLNKLSDKQIKSILDQLGIEADKNIEKNKNLILLYVTQD